MNDEAQRAFEKKNTIAQGEQKEAEGNERVWDPESGVFGETTFVRSVYEGEDK
jgi:hypothetical protein